LLLLMHVYVSDRYNFKVKHIERKKDTEGASTLKERVCYWCGSTAHRRVNRRSVLEKTFLSLIGFFPWECVICRKRVYFRDDGHRLIAKGEN
jgi:hypothetical protein